MNLPQLVYISSFPPTACGIAEYSESLARSIHKDNAEFTPLYVCVNCDAAGFVCSGNRMTLNPLDLVAVQRMARVINGFERKVVILQHEFKLYGAPDGEMILSILDSIDAPVVSTLHTVWAQFSATRHAVFTGVMARSTRVIVFSLAAAETLEKAYGVPKSKIRVVPHGVPDVAFELPGDIRCDEVPKDGVRFITAGLLRPAKGIENVVRAFGDCKDLLGQFYYVICGIDHPRNSAAGSYRKMIESLAEECSVRGHMVFINRFLNLAELLRVVQACDVGILAYTAREQSSSGILAQMLACGRPVIASEFVYAKAVVTSEMGIVVPFDSRVALCKAIERMASDAVEREKMMRKSYSVTRKWVWSAVARAHVDLIAEAEGVWRAGKS